VAPAPRRRRVALDRLARQALAEDRVGRDRTSVAVLPRGIVVAATVVAQARGVLSGGTAAVAAARACGLRVRRLVPDGGGVRAGTPVLALRGDARSVLGAERTILNLLMHASGVATATARAVRRARPSRPPLTVLATRKTLPGLRDLEKEAVVHGGGRPHRRDLAEAILVKSSHIDLVGLEPAVRRALRAAGPGEPVEVEVRTAREAVRAARLGVPALLVDNASPRRARAIVQALRAAGLRAGRSVELSGGITAETVAAYRSVGADAVSLGALTHSAPALPFHLVLRPPR